MAFVSDMRPQLGPLQENGGKMTPTSPKIKMHSCHATCTKTWEKGESLSLLPGFVDKSNKKKQSFIACRQINFPKLELGLADWGLFAR